MTHSQPRKRLICGGLSNLADGLASRVGTEIDRAKRGTGKRKAVSVAEASEQHTARCIGILVCIEHYAPETL